MADSKAMSEAWLREFLDNADCPGYETVMAALAGKWPDGDDRDWCGFEHDGEYLFFSGRDAHAEIPPEFWDHVEIVTGRKYEPHLRAAHFSCSC